MIKKYLITICCIVPITIFANDNVDLKTATESIKYKMKDPESTQFRNLKSLTNLVGEKVICGEINSKNSYGGYNGFEKFSYTNEQFIIFKEIGLGASILQQKYDISGCNGSEKERSERILKNHRENLANNPQIYQDYCGVAYGLYSNVIRNQRPKDVALKQAIEQYKNKKLQLINPDLNATEQNLGVLLSIIEKTPIAVKKIKKNDTDFENEYIKNCGELMKSKQPNY